MDGEAPADIQVEAYAVCRPPMLTHSPKRPLRKGRPIVSQQLREQVPPWAIFSYCTFRSSPKRDLTCLPTIDNPNFRH